MTNLPPRAPPWVVAPSLCTNVRALPPRTRTDRCLGGPLPRRQANQTHPHRIAINLCSSSDVLIGKHRALIRLSPGYSLLCGRLDTRYSPVRRSPSIKASFDYAAPRLACVKPVASVHPEPGSNSSLYKISSIFSTSLRRRSEIESKLSFLSLLEAL